MDWEIKPGHWGMQVGPVEMVVMETYPSEGCAKLAVLFQGKGGGLVIWVDDEGNLQVFSQGVEWKPQGPLEIPNNDKQIGFRSRSENGVHYRISEDGDKILLPERGRK